MGRGNQEGDPVAILKCKAKILYLIDTPPRREPTAVKLLESLISKLRSMLLAVPGAIGHLLAMQVDLTSARAANPTTSGCVLLVKAL